MTPDSKEQPCATADGPLSQQAPLQQQHYGPSHQPAGAAPLPAMAPWAAGAAANQRQPIVGSCQRQAAMACKSS